MPNETVLERLKRLMAAKKEAEEDLRTCPDNETPWFNAQLAKSAQAMNSAAGHALPSLIAAAEALQSWADAYEGYIPTVVQEALAPLLKEVPHE